MSLRIVTVVGARPQFIKAAPVGDALRAAGHDEILIHTGQHYDPKMSAVFFAELGIAEPRLNLEVGSGSHGAQTAQMLIGIEKVLLAEKPDWMLVFGDTNSTLAGALAACKLHVPIAHVEAGLRSFNRTMPEEHNRVLTDHCSTLLLCPSQGAADQLAREGITRGVRVVGDVMYDAALRSRAVAEQRSHIHAELGLARGSYVLATVHRAASTDDPAVLGGIIAALGALDAPVVFPVHPRTRAVLANLALPPSLRVIDPVGYLDMLMLESGARAILTDSGGVQKEAYFFGVPCLTLRDETEWTETVASGWNRVVGTQRDAIHAAWRSLARPTTPPAPIFGDGTAAAQIAAALTQEL